MSAAAPPHLPALCHGVTDTSASCSTCAWQTVTRLCTRRTSTTSRQPARSSPGPTSSTASAPPRATLSCPSLSSHALPPPYYPACCVLRLKRIYACCRRRTGRRPDATKVWNFLDNFRRGTSDGDTAGMPTDPVGADWTTLPGNFKRNGYFVTGTGKTFHPGDPYQFDYPYSWSFDEFPYGFGGGPTKGHPDWKNTTSDHIWCNNTWNASAVSTIAIAIGSTTNDL